MFEPKDLACVSRVSARLDPHTIVTVTPPRKRI